ncbi:MAG: hypothetical protein ACKPFA_05880, partial [Dolichospermum sp.]
NVGCKPNARPNIEPLVKKVIIGGGTSSYHPRSGFLCNRSGTKFCDDGLQLYQLVQASGVGSESPSANENPSL